MAEELAVNGYIYLNMESHISSRQKAEAFNQHLKPHLLEHWKKVQPDLCLDKGSEKWPQEERGRAYHLTSRKTDVEGMPRVFSGFYSPQAVLSYIVCPRMSLVHFGKQTSWKLKLLISPTWAAGHALQYVFGPLPAVEAMCYPKGMFEFGAHDQSWHIIALPNKKHGTTGLPLPFGAHIDSGEFGIYTKGVPPRLSDMTLHALENSTMAREIGQRMKTHQLTTAQEYRMLAMALHQLSILFYCETPGDLDQSTGMTGFWPRSHLVVLEGIRSLLANPNPNPKAKGNSSDTVDWDRHTLAVKKLYQNLTDHQSCRAKDPEAKTRLFEQPTMRDGQAILAIGPLVHSAMWFRELLPNRNPRSILNIKVTGARDLLQSPAHGKSVSEEQSALQSSFLQRVPTDSLLFKLYVGGSASWYADKTGPWYRLDSLPERKVDGQYLTEADVHGLMHDYVSLYEGNEPD